MMSLLDLAEQQIQRLEQQLAAATTERDDWKRWHEDALLDYKKANATIAELRGALDGEEKLHERITFWKDKLRRVRELWSTRTTRTSALELGEWKAEMDELLREDD